MPVFEVAVRVLAAGSDVLTVDAANKENAEQIARRLAIHNVDTLKLRTPIEDIIIESIDLVHDYERALTRFDSTRLNKQKLLLVLEHVPQHFWPPRPTQQKVGTLRDAIRRAIAVNRYEFKMEHTRAA